MIKICDVKYPSEETKYNHLFEEYPFQLDHFQKFGIHGIEEGHHVLVTAHTGSGKTLSAEYAIQKYCRQGKKVVYTAPIKSLSNQKFHEFTQKFPDISFGILTGDIKFNPEADCLVMTTEILRNTLFRNQNDIVDDRNQFNIDVNTELACVVFDEIHYINDRDRGKVWEETIIKLPKHVQMVMLSATIDRADEFARWISDTKGVEVWLTSTDIRVVPLNHYSYFKIHDSAFKNIKDQKMFEMIEDINGKLVPLKKHHGEFKNATVNTLHKSFNFLNKMQIYSKNKYILNQICDYLHINMMLPAICFVFSRKKVIEYANCIEWSLFSGSEQHIPNIIEKECKQILMKLPNYREYINLPEYHGMVKLLQKGIAVHHSGIIPVLREMVEMLFSKGYIKMLFATETFAVGVNMPTKTVLFTSLEKFDGNGFRYLLSHEYTQMAGRAGRRGIDTVGHVIHLNNMFNETPMLQDYQSILNGNPQTLSSKFEIDFSLLLRVIANNDNTSENLLDAVEKFIGKSMINNEIQKEYLHLKRVIEELEDQISQCDCALEKIDTKVMENYRSLLDKLPFLKNKQKKKIVLEISELESKHENLKNDYHLFERKQNLQDELEKRQQELHNTMMYIKDTIDIVCNVLVDHGFVFYENDNVFLTDKGKIASQMQEVNCLAFAEILMSGYLDELNSNELAAILSSFTDLRVPEECRLYDSQLSDISKLMLDYFDKYYDIELNCNQYVDESKYTFIYDLHDVILEWCNCESEGECKIIIQQVLEKEVFLGEFIKCVLKINNIANELQKVCDYMENVSLKEKLSKIPELTLKFVATNQSLYV